MTNKKLLFLGVICSTWLLSSPIKAQSGCDYTIGAGEQYATFESLGLNAEGTNLAGKTVCVRSNKTYGNVEIQKSGTGENQWLTIRSHPANGSVKPKFSAANDNAIQISGRYVVVDGLEVTSAGNKQGIVIVDTDHVKLLNASVSNTWSNGIHVDSSSYVWVDGCVVHKAVMSTGNPVGENVRANDSDHVWISNCLIKEDGSGRGGVLNSGQSDYITLRNNELYMNDSNNLHLGNGDNIVFENNLVSATCGNDGTGFYRMAEGYSWYKNPPYKNTNITIHNNLIVNMGMGMSFQVCQDIEASERCPFKNVTVSNNTVVGIGMANSGEKEDKEYAFFASNNSDTPVENVLIRDNIFHTNNGNENDYKSSWTGTVSFAGNLWSDMTGVPTQGNQLVNNWGSVFVSQPNLTTCVNSRINPDSYRVATSQGGKGADVNKVGIGRGGDTPPQPSVTPGPTYTPAPSPTTGPSPTGGDVPEDWDLDNDGDVDVFDFNRFVKRVMSGTEDWSSLNAFVSAFRSG